MSKSEDPLGESMTVAKTRLLKISAFGAASA
jgi:hypothetical protein